MSAVARPIGAGAPPPAAGAKPQKPRSSRLHPSDLVGLGAIGLRASRVRAALTMIGIAIGIAAMVGVLVISESSRSDLLGQLDRAPVRSLRARPIMVVVGVTDRQRHVRLGQAVVDPAQQARVGSPRDDARDQVRDRPPEHHESRESAMRYEAGGDAGRRRPIDQVSP